MEQKIKKHRVWLFVVAGILLMAIYGGNDLLTFILRLVVAFTLMLLIVVSIHEGGHYLAARYFGVYVVRFCVGFGKPILMFVDKHGTEWAFAPWPLGGYVQMLDSKTAKEKGMDKHKTLDAQNNLQSFIIYGAGPFANLILSAVIMTFVFYGDTSAPRAQIDKVYTDSPAERVGMVEGEIISRINNKPTPFWSDVSAGLLDAALSEQALTLHTDGNYYHVAAGEVVARDIEEGILRSFGIRPDENYLTNQLEAVIDNTPAATIQLQKEDEIRQVNNTVVNRWRDLSEWIAERPNEIITLHVWRESSQTTLTTAVTLGVRQYDNVTIGFLGVRPYFNREEYESRLLTVHSGFFQSITKAISRVGDDVIRTLRFMQHVVFGELSAEKNVGGPVTIARSAASISQFGLQAWWAFVALISISLAVINLVPLPILDGGRMLICIVQGIRRRNFSQQTLSLLDRIGAALIFALIIFVLLIDISRLL